MDLQNPSLAMGPLLLKAQELRWISYPSTALFTTLTPTPPQLEAAQVSRKLLKGGGQKAGLQAWFFSKAKDSDHLGEAATSFLAPDSANHSSSLPSSLCPEASISRHLRADTRKIGPKHALPLEP